MEHYHCLSIVNKITKRIKTVIKQSLLHVYFFILYKQKRQTYFTHVPNQSRGNPGQTFTLGCFFNEK